jgi:hypothetical protein
MRVAISEWNRPGWWWGVMRSWCSGRDGSGGDVRAHETAAAAVSPGRKTTGWGPQRGRRGEGRVGRSKAIGPASRWASARERGGGLRLGQKPEMGQCSKRNSFRISTDFRNLAEVWKIAQGDLGRNLTWGFFPTSSRLSKYFRKMKYDMPCYATLGKIN